MGTDYICNGCGNERGCDILGECFAKRIGLESVEGISISDMVTTLKSVSPPSKVTKQNISRYSERKAFKKYASQIKKKAFVIAKPKKKEKKLSPNALARVDFRNLERASPQVAHNRFMSWAFENGWDHTGRGFYTDGVKLLTTTQLKNVFRSKIA